MLPDLDRRWAAQPAWSVLDTDFRTGQHFLGIGAQWQACPQRPPMLHYVGLCDANHGFDAPALAQQLRLHGWTHAAHDVAHLRQGFNRLLLADGQISLTLCLGQDPEMLRELRMQAHSVLLSDHCSGWSDTHWAALALNCHVGAQVYGAGANNPSAATTLWERHGFVPQGENVLAYAPGWVVKRSRHLVSTPVRPGRCAVIGGGISGASVAHALALRGWQVTVHDRHASSAGGASGLPVGLCVPTVSADNNPLSRLTWQGVRLCLDRARRLLVHGQDWQYTGVLQKGDPAQGRPDIWHEHAAWIKPAALVRAWLNHPAIRWQGGTAVQRLQRDNTQWTLQDTHGGTCGEADMVVLANGMACKALAAQTRSTTDTPIQWAEGVLTRLAALESVWGSISILPGAHSASGPPCNGRGSWIPHVPGPDGGAAHSYIGASYERDALAVQNQTEQHRQNLERLRVLSPLSVAAMQDAIHHQQADAWAGERCVSHDRLPLVGALEKGPLPRLWICAAMGSRGLSLAPLCAELLAAWVGAEPLPVTASLAKSLSVQRPVKGHPQSRGHQ